MIKNQHFFQILCHSDNSIERSPSTSANTKNTVATATDDKRSENEEAKMIETSEPNVSHPRAKKTANEFSFH